MILTVPLLCSCAQNIPDISVVSEENRIGNSIIKWEMTPLIKGPVKVFASKNPDYIPEDNPVAMTSTTENRLTIVPPHVDERYYYKVVFNNQFSVKTANRNIIIPGVQDFRDLGGYQSQYKRKHVKWGKVYRSAEMDNLSRTALKELKNMGIRTIIDLRTPEEQKDTSALQKTFKVIHIPVSIQKVESLIHKIQKGEIHGDTIQTILEHINRNLAVNYQKEYRQMIQQLLNPETYPVVIQCSSGKGRTGIASAILLSALGVNEEIVMEDYQLSNLYFNIRNSSEYAYDLPDYSQEAITTVYSAKENFLNAAREQIERKYGSVSNYLIEGLQLTRRDIQQLRSLLLE